MGFLTNVWVNYFQRSAKLIKDSILQKIPANVPEITDLTENNPYIKQVDIFAGTHEMLGYYIDNAARESFVDSARRYESMVHHARSLDYRIMGYLPYGVDVTFIMSAPYATAVTIPKGTIVTGNSNIPYVTQDAVTIPPGSTISTPVGTFQYTQVTAANLGNGLGLPDSQIVFADKIVHNSIALTIGGSAWTSKSTLGYSLATDRDFVQNVNEIQQTVVIFGNANPYGAIPQTNQVIMADYKTTLADEGGVEAGELDTVANQSFMPPGITLRVTNATRSTGGRGPETIEEMQTNIPINLRTKDRAVTEQDFIDTANRAPGVAAAGVYNACGKTVDIYIVPDGGGVASSALVASTQAFINARKVIGRNVTVYPAGEAHVKITADVTAAASAYNSQVQADVIAALTEWLSYKNQTVKGTVYLSDIYQQIENTKDVLNSTVNRFAIDPYAQPVASGSPALNWTAVVSPFSTATQQWNIVFTSATTFTLYRGSVLETTGTVGTPVTVTEVTFTVNAGPYSAGNSYQFYTYPYNDTKIILQEPSLPVSYVSDLIINVSGGL